MPTARRTSSYRTPGYKRPSARRTSTARKTTKRATPKMSAAALREKLGVDYTKEIKITLTRADLTGTISEIATRLTRRANREGIVGEFSIIDSSSGDKWSRERVFKLVGGRPYTDAELEKEGPKLIAQKEKRDKAAAVKREKDLETLRDLAAKHGLPDPTAVGQVVDKRGARRTKTK